jgi:hypothetical protein
LAYACPRGGNEFIVNIGCIVVKKVTNSPPLRHSVIFRMCIGRGSIIVDEHLKSLAGYLNLHGNNKAICVK